MPLETFLEFLPTQLKLNSSASIITDVKHTLVITTNERYFILLSD